MTIRTTAIAITLAAAVLTATHGAAYVHGRTTGAAHWKAVIAQADKQHADEVISLQAQIAQAEHKSAAVMAAIDQHHQDDIDREQKIAADTLASYRAGTRRLRNEFQPYIVADHGVSGAAASASQRDEASAVGLQPAHVEFLVQFGSDADQVADQLRACQAVVRADRGQP